MLYKRCFCCGNYFEVNDDNKDSDYCSIECMKRFSMCKVCGNYFEIVFNNKYHNNNCCSSECYSVIYKKK